MSPTNSDCGLSKQDNIDQLVGLLIGAAPFGGGDTVQEFQGDKKFSFIKAEYGKG